MTRQRDWDRAVAFLGWRAPLWLTIITSAFWPLWAAKLTMGSLTGLAPGWLRSAVIALGWAQVAVLAIGLPRLFATARLSRALRHAYELRKDVSFVLAAAPRIPVALRRETLSANVLIAIDAGDFMGFLPGHQVMAILDEHGARIVPDDPASTHKVLAQLRAIPRGAAIHRLLRAR